MAEILCTKSYEEPPFDVGEILRYAGGGQGTAEVSELMERCLSEVRGKLSYKVCYREFPLSSDGERLDLGFVQTASADLKKNLAGCDRLVLFAATIGIGLDRLIAKYSRLSPSMALMLQAIGAERIESLCDLFNEEIRAEKAKEGKTLRPRFSPGYGDLPLALQKDIFRVLDCPRKIGLTLNESLLMSPTKSVTALIGVSAEGEKRKQES